MPLCRKPRILFKHSIFLKIIRFKFVWPMIRLKFYQLPSPLQAPPLHVHNRRFTWIKPSSPPKVIPMDHCFSVRKLFEEFLHKLCSRLVFSRFVSQFAMSEKVLVDVDYFRIYLFSTATIKVVRSTGMTQFLQWRFRIDELNDRSKLLVYIRF